MRVIQTWRWIRYPRIALQDRRRTAYLREDRGPRLRDWWAALGALAVLVALVSWPAPRYDVQPLLERRAEVPTPAGYPLERAPRPPHPREIYTPPGR